MTNKKEDTMSKLTKEQALAKIEELKKYVDQVDVETDKPIAINSRYDGSIIYQSTKPTLRGVVVEAVGKGANLRDANLRDANLIGANLIGADLSSAELQNAKFYGKGGAKELKRSQLVDFLHALGFNIVED